MNNLDAALARKDDQAGPAALVKRYSDAYTGLLPSHIKGDQWLKIALGAIKKGPIDQASGRPLLEVAAASNPHAFMQALAESARLGLMPGTDEYYLTPRKVQGRWEVLGIPGYMGYIELMYRAGAVTSVVVELVREFDQFQYNPGRDTVPLHDIDWTKTHKERGDLRLVYAYAHLANGAVSKVVVLNRDDINLIKASSPSANSNYSPWAKHEGAMWMKTAIRQLRKWVPTSSEYLRSQAEVDRVAAVRVDREFSNVVGDLVNRSTGEILDNDPDAVLDVEAELVEDES